MLLPSSQAPAFIMDAVKMRTPSDFEDPTLSPKRKRHTSIACGHCRKLKIRCQGGHPALGRSRSEAIPCENCLQHGRLCEWPEEDGRRLKRQRSLSTSRQSAQSSAASDASDSPNVNFFSPLGGDVPVVPSLPIVEEYAELSSQHFENLQTPSVYPTPELHHTGFQLPPAVEHHRRRRSMSTASEPSYSTVRYYRYHGHTALAPGLKHISLKPRREDSDPQSLLLSPMTPQTPATRHLPNIFDPITGLPRSPLLGHLLDKFFEHFGDIFCFLNKDHTLQQVHDGHAPVFLICTMSALSARFCDPQIYADFLQPVVTGATRDTWEYAIPFLEKAKSMVMSCIGLPSAEGIAGLLLLAYAEYGDNNEAGHWMFTGMAMRMVQELGLQRHRPARGRRGSFHNERPGSGYGATVDLEAFNDASEVLLFWAVFTHDVALCNATGRVPQLKSREINVRLPTSNDIATVCAGPGKNRPLGLPNVFGKLAQMTLVVAKSVEFLNTEASHLTQDTRLHRVEDLKHSLVQAYESLPPEVAFGGNNYKAAGHAGQAGPYLLLHLHYYLQVAFLCQEGLAETPNVPAMTHIQGTPREEFEKQTHALYRASIKAITDMLTMAKLIDDRPCLTVIDLNQAFFHAACAYSRDMQADSLQRADEQRSPSSSFPVPSAASPSVGYVASPSIPFPAEPRSTHDKETGPSLVARSNYQFLRHAIKQQAVYFAGSGWVDAVLDQRENTLRDVDLSVVSEGMMTFVRLHDLRGSEGVNLSSEAGGMREVMPNASIFTPPAPRQAIPPTTSGLDKAVGGAETHSLWDNASSTIPATDAELFTTREPAGTGAWDPQAFFSEYMFNGALLGSLWHNAPITATTGLMC